MDEETFRGALFLDLMELYDLETIELLGDAKFAVEVARLAKPRSIADQFKGLPGVTVMKY